ncbi:MAG: 3'(2'),5'-bisphosphate nucleotidase [Rhodospirillaceae bacterium]|nr:3'(2'),5'-bisphosphate nucleotidase [Rhodospirillaceae bacterium]|tara:strand:+ start:5279 stop:6028 length:750 start_codon:yes stop_codon:yes gene_type:complete
MIIQNDIFVEILNIAFSAGKSILEVKKNKIDVNYKNDKSPITNADRQANDIIMKKLRVLTPEIEIISEENKNNPLISSDIFWMIDPLDGTKEFINGSDDFTVNIGLIKNKIPIFGLIYAPSKDITYYTKNNCSYILLNKNSEKKIETKKNKLKYEIALMSNSHNNKDTEDFINNNAIPSVKKVGSSLKFCLVASGEGDIYPRFGRTMEWDTAAGQAIVEAAGGKVELLNGNALTYGKKNFINPSFICKS